MKIKVLLLLLGAMLLIVSCSDSEKGESYFNLPEGPKMMFRGGYGKVTIRYFPPPPPVFKVAQATKYIDFKKIKNNYGIPDKPLIVEYIVESSVMSAVLTQRTAKSQFNEYILKSLQGWMYTRYGKGRLKLKIDVAKRKIWVDATGISLAEPEPGKPEPRVGSPSKLAKASGFTIHSGEF